MDATTLVGRTLDRYLLDDLLGQGSMGVVYRARDLVTSCDVALKVLAPRDGCDDLATARFRREALWLSYCHDPHIVHVYATGQAKGFDYIAMELMTATLQSRASEGRSSIEALASVGAGILLGLAAAHRVGIIHRDIKPANVGISKEGTIKLLDFGVAHPLPWSVHVGDSATVAGPPMCVGSVPYMPPEQLRGGPIDERADLYSTGAVLYELATGHRVFPEMGSACLIDAILNAKPAPPSKLTGCLTQDLDSVLLRALEKNPSKRFQSALAMMDALLALEATAAARVRSALDDEEVGSDSIGWAVSSSAFLTGRQ
jgi:serine/threonine protein kinase